MRVGRCKCKQVQWEAQTSAFRISTGKNNTTFDFVFTLSHTVQSTDLQGRHVWEFPTLSEARHTRRSRWTSVSLVAFAALKTRTAVLQCLSTWPGLLRHLYQSKNTHSKFFNDLSYSLVSCPYVSTRKHTQQFFTHLS